MKRPTPVQPPMVGTVAHTLLASACAAPQTRHDLHLRLDGRRWRLDPDAAVVDGRVVVRELNSLADRRLLERTAGHDAAGRRCDFYRLTPLGEQLLDVLAQLQEPA